MKVGDLVKPIDPDIPNHDGRALQTTLVEKDWMGVIIGWEGCDPIVFWNEKFPAEVEYSKQIEVLCESR